MRGLLQLKVLPSAHEGRPPSLVRVKAPFALGISNLGLLPDNGMIGGSIWAGSEEITPVCNGTCIGPDESIWGEVERILSLMMFVIYLLVRVGSRLLEKE